MTRRRIREVEIDGMRCIILTILLLASGVRAEVPRVVEAGSVEVIPFPGHSVALLADPQATPAGAAVMELQVPPRTFGAPPHVHSREDEFFYVIEGSIHLLDGEETVTAGPGPLVVLQRGHLHGFWNDSAEAARLLLIVTPGEFASLFDEVVAQIRKTQPADSNAVGSIIAEVASKHAVQIHPEKAPASARHLLPR